ncbi:hypothetical protein [Croceitalea rosinachiae]|uniref:Uncharacterized protein n=1 Tax=Croceitalea rosinachiae TaxID=3075596 RepID=A0ABU3ACW5_9FLAO|nr:hypothetical protein [Croceitalea sp. F388]MDT0608018.1 hypothetical protein [Croceitalea sp. F388]
MKKVLRKYRTDFLFPKSSFITGMGSAFDFTGNYYSFNTSKTPELADYKAMQSDWGMVGEDIKVSVDEIKEQISHKD